MAVGGEDALARAGPEVANRYRILLILTVVYALNVLDRYILGVLLPQIKHDLAVNDTYLGVLTGAGFAIFYATLGIPLASVAERTSRKGIIAASLALFSVMTAICGFARTFAQLFVARIGVAVGEPGTQPAIFFDHLGLLPAKVNAPKPWRFSRWARMSAFLPVSL